MSAEVFSLSELIELNERLDRIERLLAMIVHQNGEPIVKGVDRKITGLYGDNPQTIEEFEK